ncbi:DUF4189 domain-containing protein [Variovorax paradoxus]|uniref:DUF4189 domain-containing protein n=1 Tax=Variovorax paradoxus TaxID=34073 RepID=UPI00278B566E|nr:DUF4189 domain-containing protein [Variovorax paradoxus]MDP9932140.1 hypothetical protein [Variovorax paradoxus]
MRSALRTAALWLGLLMASFGVHAEGGFCPPGTIDHNNGRAAAIVCSPIPGYGQQQAPQQPAEVWQDRFGAIAIDSPNRITASAVNMRNEGSAKATAISNCKAQGGVTCEVEITFKNGCGAVTTSDTNHVASVGANIDDASAAGLKSCRSLGDPNCRVYYKVCSPAVRVR